MFFGGGFGNYTGNALPTPPDPFAGVNFAALAQQLQPKTGAEMMGEMNAAQAAAPAGLRLSDANVSEGAINAARSRYFNDYARPGIEQLKADLASEGRDNSTFGAAALAQADQEGRRQAYYAGEDLIDRALQRWQTKRNSYFGNRGGEGGLVTNDRGGDALAQLTLGAANARTNFDNAWWQNNLDYSKLKDQSDWMGRRAGVGGFQTFGGALLPYGMNALGKLGGAAWGGIKNFFGGGGGGAQMSASSGSPFPPISFAQGSGGWGYKP